MTWGKTFMLHEDDRSFQGIYVGAGPYLATQAFFEFDSELEKILSGSGNTYIPSASLGLGGGETDQLALDITGSYRARFPLFARDGAGASRNGMYVAANYHHLQGFRFDEFDAKLQLDTDSNGLVSPDPPEMPFMLEWQTSSKGWGLSPDFGVAFVVNRWDFGAGVSGVAQPDQVERHHSTRGRPCESRQRQRVYPRQAAPHPHDDSIRAASHLYRRRRLSQGCVVCLLGVLARFRGTNFRTSLEYRLGGVELRGAGRYSQGSWYPSGGAGFNLTRNFGIDAGLYGTRTFLEAKAHVGLAISLRFDRRSP